MHSLRAAFAIAAILVVGGCGSGGSRHGVSSQAMHTSGTASSGPARSAAGASGAGTTSTGSTFTPAERRAIAAQRLAQRAQFSPVALNSRMARLHGRARRRAVVRAAERAILRDALGRYARHELDKRAKYVTCSVSPDDAPLVARNRDAPVVRYQCLAVTFRVDTKPPTLAGIDFVARVNFAAPSFAWCLFVPVGGEGTHAAATLAAPPPPACIADPPR